LGVRIALEVYNTWKVIKNKYLNLIIGLGNFDGVHLGHQRLISWLVSEAGALGGTPAVLTFDPHPLQVLCGKAPPKLLLQESKQEIISRLGVEVLLVIPFTTEFAALSPEEFIEKVLVRQLNVKSVFIGYNYSFGKGGRGTPETIADIGRRFGFRVHVVPPVKVDGVPVSSTLIRGLMTAGEVSEAQKFLGYHPFIEGKVVTGDRIGRTIGFPTANLCLTDGLAAPANGVYAVVVKVDGDDYQGVANIGLKPTFRDCPSLPNLEVHLLDFRGDLYGKKIKVSFIRRIREERRFSSPGELIEQINMDISRVKYMDFL